MSRRDIPWDSMYVGTLASDPSPSPLDLLILNETMERIGSRVTEYPESEQKRFWFVYEEIPVREAAGSMGETRSTYQDRKKRLLADLKKVAC